MSRSLHREGMTAQDHREAAAASARRRSESYDRSDTDGFLSQWASGLNAQEHEAWADLLDNGGMTEVRALFLLDGRLASVREVEGQYGWSWLLTDEAAEVLGKRFVSDSNARKASTRQKNNAAKGVSVGRIRVKGYVTTSGSGTGLSGAASVRVVTRPDQDALKAGEFEVVTTDAVRDGLGFDSQNWN